MTDIAPVFSLEGVRRTFKLGETDLHALRDVTLHVQPGEVVFVRGPSGAGKSTLLNHIALLDTPDAGTVRFLGQDVSAISDAERTRLRGENVGIIFQSFNLVPVLSAVENVALPLMMRKDAPRDAEDQAMALLAEVDMTEHARKRVTLLSGGQRQRVAIARALIQTPKLIVADEPTANLDSGNGAKVLSILMRLNSQFGATLVLATHDQALRATASREIAMMDGVIADDVSLRAAAE